MNQHMHSSKDQDTARHDGPGNGRDFPRDESGTLISASKVEGTACYDCDGKKIGAIDDVMLDKYTGKVAYAIMSFGGFLGIGEKYHPVPWHRLDYDTSVGGYRIDMAGATLKDAPSYDRAQIDHGKWGPDADRHYGVMPPSTAGVGSSMAVGTSPQPRP